MSRIPDIWSTAKMVELLSDEEFVDALTNVEGTIQQVNNTLDRVEEVEAEAGQAVTEANETLKAVDNRLTKVDETISLLEAKIEAGFSLGFFVVAVNLFLRGDLILAVSLAALGMLGAGALVVTIVTLPQVRKLRQAVLAAIDRLNGTDEDDREFPSVFDNDTQDRAESEYEMPTDDSPGQTDR
jgi:hypothetical protein